MRRSLKQIQQEATAIAVELGSIAAWRFDFSKIETIAARLNEMADELDNTPATRLQTRLLNAARLLEGGRRNGGTMHHITQAMVALLHDQTKALP